MAEFLTDPSVLTKDKLKSALLANNVLLPNGDQRKGVYVDLYLKNLTVQNQNRGLLSAESFSSDEEPSTGRTTDRNRSGRKATKKSDRVREEEVDVTALTDGNLKEQLLKYNVNVGPIVASTRKLYEKKLQRLLDQGPPETVVMVSQTVQTDSRRNWNDDSDQYSDKEEETEAAVLEPEPEPEPEPVPVVERPLRSRGKTPVTSRTRSNQNKIEKSSSAEQNPKTPERNILREMFPYDTLSTPTGISATCRQPIKGAAGRPLGDVWLDDLRPRLTEIKRTSSSSYTESRSIPRLIPSPPAVPLSATRTPALSSTRPKSKRRPPVWVQLLLVGAVAGFLLFVYQVMERNETSPFSQQDDSAALHRTGQ